MEKFPILCSSEFYISELLVNSSQNKISISLHKATVPECHLALTVTYGVVAVKICQSCQLNNGNKAKRVVAEGF